MVDSKSIAKVINCPGSVVVMATDTVYGLVARADDKQATTRLYALKKRQSKPGTLIGLDIDQLVSLGITRRYLVAVKQFWPGPVSVIVPCSKPELSYLTQGLSSLALRIPDDQFVEGVLKLTGPLITSSANLPGHPPAETIAQAKAYFHDSVDAYFDSGSLAGRQPSSVIKVIDDAIEVIRRGQLNIPGL
jgi:L-threonylcarbamoyladenylate synthase